MNIKDIEMRWLERVDKEGKQIAPTVLQFRLVTWDDSASVWRTVETMVNVIRAKVEMTNKQAIITSIEHHKRMLAWAKKQPGKKEPDQDDMETTINENWQGNYCALCEKYLKTCSKCPLAEKYGVCDSSNQNVWAKLNTSQTWGEWCKVSRKMIKQLESLLE